jgi:selenocysteine lyase/cysteine desulfurase
MSLVEPGTFRVPAGYYLLSHSVGLPLGDAQTRLAVDVLDAWAGPPSRTWLRWLDEIEGFRRALAELLNHGSEWFCPQANVSSAFTKILHALSLPADRRTILLPAHTFPSLGFVAERAHRVGYSLRFVPGHEDLLDPEAWAAYLTPDVGIVLVTHVPPNTGEQVPVRAVIEQARQRQVVTVVDIAQSAGSLPIDLTEWDAEFVVGSCVKWLCGGPGAGYLWVSPGIIGRCEPLDVGWFSHDDPFEFDVKCFRYADDALRFWGGTPSVIPASIARRSIELLTNIGIHRMHAHNVTLTDRLVANVPDDMLVSPRRPADRSGTVVIDAGVRTDELLRRCEAAQVHVDRRGSGIRASTHLYNTTEDVDAMIALLPS